VEHVSIVKHYITPLSSLACQAIFLHKFSESPVLDKSTFYSLRHFCDTRNVHDNKCKLKGRGLEMEMMQEFFGGHFISLNI
jgi:hypothetical protein